MTHWEIPVGQPGPEPSLKSRFWPLNCRYEPLRAGEKSSIGGPLWIPISPLSLSRAGVPPHSKYK
eukprot:scaffold26748_cov85-Skeletonema_menzelii.AAC.1